MIDRKRTQYVTLYVNHNNDNIPSIVLGQSGQTKRGDGKGVSPCHVIEFYQQTWNKYNYRVQQVC